MVASTATKTGSKQMIESVATLLSRICFASGYGSAGPGADRA